MFIELSIIDVTQFFKLTKKYDYVVSHEITLFHDCIYNIYGYKVSILSQKRIVVFFVLINFFISTFQTEKVLILPILLQCSLISFETKNVFKGI